MSIVSYASLGLSSYSPGIKLVSAPLILAMISNAFGIFIIFSSAKICATDFASAPSVIVIILSESSLPIASMSLPTAIIKIERHIATVKISVVSMRTNGRRADFFFFLVFLFFIDFLLFFLLCSSN